MPNPSIERTLAIMTAIPGYWDVGPHDPIPVEETWQDFVRHVGGQVVTDFLPEPRKFENADFYFPELGVVAELKEIETEFSKTPAFVAGFDELMNRLVTEKPDWKPVMFGGSGEYPNWFVSEFIRIFRSPISRILKKANRQIRDTKSHLGIKEQTGLLLLVNDGFTSLEPHFVRTLACNLLSHSYSSIDCFLYLTVNRYVDVGSRTPSLLWVPTYSDRAPDSLVSFIDDLGRKWIDFLEQKIGPFTEKGEVPQSANLLHGAHAIVLLEPNDG